MKTTIKNLMLAFVLIAGLNTYAADFNVALKEGFTLTVSLDQVGSDSTILLKDDQGVLLYSKELNNKEETLDLKNLPNGTYSLLMENDLVFEKTMIVKNTKGLSIFNDAEGTVFKPSFKKVDQMLRMSLTNPTSEKVNFTVYDANGLQVASAEGKGYVIKKSFDFNNGKSGNYVIKTTVGTHSFSKTISMN
jgi:Tfp pilus assembly PilM family ATPase